MNVTDKIRLHHVDCMEFMRGLPDKYYDLAIVDPPYGIGAEKSFGMHKFGWKQHDRKEWDNSIPTFEYWEQLFRVSKNQIVWGGNYMTEFLPPSMGWIVWNKMQRDFSLADGEMAWTSFNKAMRIFDLSRGAAVQENNQGLEKFHPTAKPISLYKWLLDKYAKPNDKILDTHGGSMSIAIACHDYGFELDLCELDAEYYAKGVERVQNHVKQLKMF
jgi:site-specific DNA-methyltransferase (adenine-specific)